MLEGKCPSCGARYFGWALRSPDNQICGECNVPLEIKDQQGDPLSGLWLSNAEEYKVASPRNEPYRVSILQNNRFSQN